MRQPTIVWFRSDLRLADNPSLTAAMAEGGGVIPVYILDDAAAGAWRPGGAARWWLHGSLAGLQASLAELGLRLRLLAGDSAEHIDRLVAESGASAVVWNRRYEPWAIVQDKAIKASLERRGIRARSFNGSLGREPWEVHRDGGEPYKVFTPFWRAWAAQGPLPEALPAPGPVAEPVEPDRDSLAALDLLPTTTDWAGGLREAWRPGEAQAWAELDDLVDGRLRGYKAARDFPGKSGVSRLSPRLHHGELSSRQIWHRSQVAVGSGAEAFLRQLVWREFAHHLLFHFPELPDTPLRAEFARFPWAEDEAAFGAWCRGRTGYPIVDAGMRELWHTGYMHNRVRMVVASFLTKDLLISWQKGAAWFWDTLCDADLANNSMGWQWVAGCGTDAAPYFRIFNPVSQGAKFDPAGSYVRPWVPELAKLPDEHLQQPWEASTKTLADAGVSLGQSYPRRIVEHGAARARALAAFQGLKE